MKTPSKDSLLARVRELETQFHLYNLALCDMTEQREDRHVKWFRHGTCKLGVVRARGAAGGIVIEMHELNGKGPEFIGLHYWKSWHESARRFCFDHPGDRHAENLLRAIDSVAKHIRETQAEFFAPKVADAVKASAEV